MTDVHIDETAIQIRDRAGNSLQVETQGWETIDAVHEIEQRHDTAISGRVSGLHLPRGYVGITSLDGTEFEGERSGLNGEGYRMDLGEMTSLPGGSYFVRSELPIAVFLRFDAPVTIHCGTDRTVISFPNPTAVTIGFRSQVAYPSGTVTVPHTPDGLATALTHLSSALRTMSPDRSFPTLRGHPPRIAFGEESIPSEIREQTPETGIELLVPAAYEALYPAAPLAYYLGARVETADVDAPVLHAPAADVTHEFDPVPAFQYQAARLLRRVFLLDSIVRNAGPYGINLTEVGIVEPLGLDHQTCYEAEPPERLARYLRVDFDRVSDDLPPWRHAIYLDPETTAGTALATALHRLCQVFLPDAAEERVRAAAGVSDTTSGSSDAKTRWLTLRVAGTLGNDPRDGTYRAIPEAYEHRLASLGRDTQKSTVAVVGFDETIESFGEAYRDRSSPATDVSTIESPTCEELVDVFESFDLVHFRGECVDGFACTDETLTVAEFDTIDTELFVLDAPNSVQTGVDLVQEGSVAGLVSQDDTPLDAGPEIMSLLLDGFSLQESLQVARRVDAVQNGLVVGDGEHRICGWQSDLALNEVENPRDGEFTVVGSCYLPIPGGVYTLDESQPRLSGHPIRMERDVPRFRKGLEESNISAVYDGELYWPEDYPRLLYPLV